jgi:hypothetical protein
MTTDAEPPSIPLPALGAETMAIIHDNLGIVLTYAFSKQALDEYRGWLVGNRWYVADRVLLELPRQHATRAIIELALMFRALDSVSEITKHDYVATHPYVVYHSTGYIYGKLYDLDGASRQLPLCDVPNKVIHAKRIDWNFDNPKEPLVICHAAETEYARFKWARAEVFVNAFAAVCAALASPRR